MQVKTEAVWLVGLVMALVLKIEMYGSFWGAETRDEMVWADIFVRREIGFKRGSIITIVGHGSNINACDMKMINES